MQSSHHTRQGCKNAGAVLLEETIIGREVWKQTVQCIIMVENIFVYQCVRKETTYEQIKVLVGKHTTITHSLVSTVEKKTVWSLERALDGPNQTD